VKTLESITSSQVRQWKSLTARLAPGKSFIVENHGQAEAVIMHPSDVLESKAFDLEAHFATVRASKPMPPMEIVRAPEL